nr:cell surface protein SprA [Gelidibacter sp.]
MVFFLGYSGFSQELPVPQDSTKTGHSFGTIKMPNPNSIISKYTYDPVTDRYIYTETVGKFNINYPLILTPKEFQKLMLEQNLKSYYKQKIDIAEGKKEGTEGQQKNLLPEFYVNSGFFETVFGGNTIEVIPQGSVEMDLGVLFTKQDNPSFSPRNRSNFTFDFDQRISLSLLGKVGTRLQVTANYDTQSTFDFQNLIKLEYTPTEDDIVRKIEVGNVSMPLNSSLITGAQSLFGVKTELQFGKTRVTAVFSEQKSQSRSVIAQGGGTLDEFSFYARDYDENRHFFLAQYFRERYDIALQRYPHINSNVQITRVEVWITNKSNQTDNVRNIVAFQDLGESQRVGSSVNILVPGSLPNNKNNGFDPTNIGGAGSNLNSSVRDITRVEQGINIPANEGFDFGKLENARKLTEGYDYTLQPQLGYISLNQRLQNDEVLAVAFQYTVGSNVYQVGEFANDGIEATGTSMDPISGNTVINNNNLILKMLKSAITNVNQPIWDLMMKNIYDSGAYQLSQEDFKLNIFYTEASPLNYIKPVEGTTFPLYDNNTPDPTDDTPITETPLIRLFHLDRLNYNNDPQLNGDGFFDFVPGITVLTQNGKIIFTKVEPFGKYLFDVLADPAYPSDYNDAVYANPNQEKYVYDILYKGTKTAALEQSDKNKFQLKGRYKSTGGDGISIGAFNVPRGSVKVTAGGRVLVEGVDYTVNYQLGRVEILDQALKASNTPINVSVENNAVFGQQTKRFTGLNVEHQFNEKFVLGATFLNLNERPITQKANYDTESINNTIFGFNGNYSTEVPFLTRLANKLPNIDTDVPSNLSVRGEFAYLLPGAPKGTDFQGETTAYVDDFEGSQGSIDLLSPQSWFLSSRPKGLGIGANEDQIGIQNGFNRAHLNWYTIDPIFYSVQRPKGITDNDLSNLYTRRVFIDEIFPQRDLVQGQSTIIPTLDLVYYPSERGPYNFQTQNINYPNTLTQPQQSWAGITRAITSTDFEQANVEYIEFWLQDPFLDNTSNPGGKLLINLGNISEDIIKDGKKQYENGLPDNGDISGLPVTDFGSIVPRNQSLIYAFSSLGSDRANQDVGYDGYNDAQEIARFGSQFGPDPSNDNYTYFLQAEGDIFDRYKRYNGSEGNSPDAFSDTNRGSTTQPDVEDINRDNTMNTIDSYFEYEIDITRGSLDNPNNALINDVKTRNITLPNGDNRDVRWYQFRIPIDKSTRTIGGISDIRSIRFARMYLKEFSQTTVMRFATLDLVRSDWRRYTLDLDSNPNNNSTDASFSVGVIGLQENEGNYVLPPGVELEKINSNNNIIRQNEQSLVVEVCELEGDDSRGVYKNISVDMRQYKKLKMFMHAEASEGRTLNPGEMIGFIRMGNDFTQNFYEIQVPLNVVSGVGRDQVWPSENEININLDILQKIKALGISDGTLANQDPTFYNVTSSGPELLQSGDNFEVGETRVGIKGNPNFGDIRVLMVGVKNNTTATNLCGKVWFNELRLSDLDNEGGWAAILSMDSNIADFADISATGRQSTVGFGSIEQRPNERSREDIMQYDVVTNINLGQLLPKKWGVQLPFNYAQSEEMVTPKYDQFYNDLTLDSRLEAASSSDEKDQILKQSEDYTKRKSINFIGVRKQRTGDGKPRFYDVENLTFNYSYNKVEHRDFEIENALDQNLRTGVNYAYNFQPITIEPFAKNDSIFKSRYAKILKDFNFNLLPNSFTINSDILRQFNKQKFREVELGGNNIGLEELFRRNYRFDFQYAINYKISKSMNLNFMANNTNIVRNYFIDDIINGKQDPNLDIWDGFFELGDPNIQNQQLQLNYELPLYKIPTFSFLKATYSYTGDFQWQKGSDLNTNMPILDETTGITNHYNLGNSIQNANTHNINSTFNMETLYRYVGLTRKDSRRRTQGRATGQPRQTGSNGNASPQNRTNVDGTSVGTKVFNTFVDLATMVKRVQINYSENNGTFLPGYLQTPGFIGTLKPTLGYTFGSQSDIRDLAARNGWLSVYPDFNQQYTEVTNRTLDVSANIEVIKDLKIDLIGNRMYSENLNENYNALDTNGDGLSDTYNALIRNSFGNFSISTSLIKTAFGKSDEVRSEAFEDFRANRLIVSKRLARNFYGSDTYPLDADGYPVGFGKNNQAVLLPAFLSAYQGSNPDKVSMSAFRDIPIPNWTLKYTGLMRLNWFKDKFKRFSVSHGYRSGYTINQFRTNLDYDGANPQALDQGGNFKNQTIFSNINLEEHFSPLIKLDFETKSSVKILAEVKKDRILSLSFDNNLLTEINGYEYVLGLGYRIKDVRIRSKMAGPQQTIVADLNMKADISLRDNKTIIRYLDLDDNQVTSGQTIWGIKYSADYAFSKNLTGIFYFDYTFSDYAISTAFPQTTIRSGITLRYNFGN